MLAVKLPDRAADVPFETRYTSAMALCPAAGDASAAVAGRSCIWRIRILPLNSVEERPPLTPLSWFAPPGIGVGAAFTRAGGNIESAPNVSAAMRRTRVIIVLPC